MHTVVPRSRTATRRQRYGPKKDAFAAAGVPVYLIVDPYTGTWHLHTLPKDGEYRGVLKTDEFPRD